MDLLTLSPVEYGRVEIVKEGCDMAFLSVGQSVFPSYYAAKRLEKEGISIMVVNVRFIKPLDTEFFSELTEKIKLIITIEENMIAGGFGSSFLEFLNSLKKNDVTVETVGLPDSFIEHGKQDLVRQLYRLDTEGIYQTALSLSERLDRR